MFCKEQIVTVVEYVQADMSLFENVSVVFFFIRQTGITNSLILSRLECINFQAVVVVDNFFCFL